jgi:thymidine phosphorylase
MLSAKLGDRLEKGAPLATIYSSDRKKLAEGVKMFMSAVEVRKSKPSRPKLIREILT